jgi:flagellar basal body-associated protein FliL
MKRIIMLGIVLVVTMLVSLGGCFWGYEDHGRGGGHDRGEGHDHDRGEGHDHDRGGEHDERK